MKNSYYSISKFEFWNKIKKLENKGSFIVHSNKYNYLFTVLTNKPNFLLFPNIDIVNYFPQYVPFIAIGNVSLGVSVMTNFKCSLDLPTALVSP